MLATKSKRHLMGWTDLFKSKSSKLKADSSLRWFGKLSTCRDYFNSKVDEEWVAEFNDWVMKGYEFYHARMASQTPSAMALRQTDSDTSIQRQRHLSPAACILRLPKSGMTVLASIQDYGGDSFGRPFPLCFYVGLPTAQWLGPTADSIGPALDILNRLLHLRDDVVRFERTPSRFESVFGGRELPLDGLNGDTYEPRWRMSAAELAIDDWFAAIAPSLLTPDWPTWHALVSRWGQTIASMDPNSFEATLVFPLGGGIPAGVQICGWLAWLTKKLDLAKRPVSLFWCEEAAQIPSRLNVVARTPIEDDFLLITPIGGRLTYLDSACALRETQKEEAIAPGAPLPERFAELVIPTELGGERLTEERKSVE